MHCPDAEFPQDSYLGALMKAPASRWPARYYSRQCKLSNFLGFLRGSALAAGIWHSEFLAAGSGCQSQHDWFFELGGFGVWLQMGLVTVGGQDAIASADALAGSPAELVTVRTNGDHDGTDLHVLERSARCTGTHGLVCDCGGHWISHPRHRTRRV